MFRILFLPFTIYRPVECELSPIRPRGIYAKLSETPTLGCSSRLSLGEMIVEKKFQLDAILYCYRWEIG